jgi:hypothetical protein
MAIGLGMSSRTLLNPQAPWPTGEKDRLEVRYGKFTGNGLFQGLSSQENNYLQSTDAIAIIRSNPLWYLLKIPIRGLALLFPWTYQPWSLPHVLYEAVYTIFIITGLVLLMRRGSPSISRLVLIAIPLSIWLFLSVYGIDNDLKNRNGMLVGLNLIAPLGYFLASRPRRISPESDSEQWLRT